MTIISSQFLLAPGLKNATGEQKAACVKDKAINGLKHTGAQLGVVAAVGGAGYAAAKSEAVQNAFVKVANGAKKVLEKGAKKLGKTEALQNAIKNIKDSFGLKNMTNDSKAALVFGGIALLGAAVSSAIAIHQIHQNGKIEGQHQAKVDAANAEA